jgi:hypothetical protein
MSPQPCGDTPLWRNWNFGLLPNSSYVETLMLGYDNCSEGLNFTDSVFLIVETIGFWIIDVNNTWPEGWDNDGMQNNGGVIVTSDGVGDNTVENPEISDFESVWYHVYFTPMMFNVTIFADVDFYYTNVTDFYYTNMTDLYENNMTEGFCMPMLDYWNNETVGCPCNDTWDTTGYYNSSSNSFMGGRQIIPSQCSNESSCGEMMFLNDTMKYANVRINFTECKNGSVLKTLEFTRTSYDQDVGYTYGAQDIWYVFGAWDQKAVVNSLVGENNTITRVPEVSVIGPNNYTFRGDNNSNVSGSNGLPMSMMITMIFIFFVKYNSS